MLKLTYRYDQTAARLMVQGLPDSSADHGDHVLGILSSWKLEFIGSPTLEGRREHLEAMLATVLPYVRYLLSGVSKPCGSPESPVHLAPAASGGHRLELRSSQPEVEPLALHLDDAELADLVRCLDAMRLDPRVQIGWMAHNDRPLARRELADRIPLIKRFAAPLLGGSTLAAVALLTLLLPLPDPKPTPSAKEPTSTSQPAIDPESSASSDAPQGP
ncbi:MAG: DUF4335 domain-containing protein [Synechococcus sp.]